MFDRSLTLTLSFCCRLFSFSFLRIQFTILYIVWFLNHFYSFISRRSLSLGSNSSRITFPFPFQVWPFLFSFFIINFHVLLLFETIKSPPCATTLQLFIPVNCRIYSILQFSLHLHISVHPHIISFIILICHRVHHRLHLRIHQLSFIHHLANSIVYHPSSAINQFSISFIRFLATIWPTS